MPIMSNGKQFVIFGHRHDQKILPKFYISIGHKLLTVQKHGIFMNLEV